MTERKYKEKRDHNVEEVLDELPGQLIIALRDRLNEPIIGLDLTMIEIASARADFIDTVFLDDALAAVDKYFDTRTPQDKRGVVNEDRLYKRHRDKIKELLSCFYPSTKNQVPELLSHINQAASHISN